MNTQPEQNPATPGRVVVVGAGIAGLTAALELAAAGQPVTLVHKGLGGLQLSQGTLDVLGYVNDATDRVERPFEGFASLPGEHPYHLIGQDAVVAGLSRVRETLRAETGADLLCGDVDANHRFPTAVGALRPTALVPRSMWAGRHEPGKKYLIVGIDELKDYHPQLIAGNMQRVAEAEGLDLSTRFDSLSLPAREGEHDCNPVQYARAMDRPEFRARFAAELKKLVQPGEVVGVPAVLGLNDPQVHAEIEKAVGAEVFEITSQPPCIPGMRLNQALTAAVKAAGVRMILGAEVCGLETEGGRVTAVQIKTAGRVRSIAARGVVHCPGGFESGALAVDSYNHVTESIFGLPVTAEDATELIHGDYWGRPQPLFAVGVPVDEAMRPVADGKPLYPNLTCAGGVLAGAMRWGEKSGEGIAVGSAVVAASTIIASTTTEGAQA